MEDLNRIFWNCCQFHIHSFFLNCSSLFVKLGPFREVIYKVQRSQRTFLLENAEHFFFQTRVYSDHFLEEFSSNFEVNRLTREEKRYAVTWPR